MKFKSYCKRGESRKGQITLFILMGIVLLLIVGLGVYLKGIVSEQDDLEVLYISDLDSYIETCIENSLESQVPFMSARGGVLREDFLYKGDSYNLICYEEEGRGCINTFLTKEDMQKELSLNLLPLVDKCIDLSIFEQQGFLIKKGTLKVDVFIGFDDVRLNLEYPLTLERLGQIIKKNTFSAKISSPLGRLHSLAQHILNQEILFDNFDKDQWAKKYGSSIRIEKMKPYPATLYKLTTVNRHGKKYAYHFGKLGKASVLEIGLSRSNIVRNPTCVLKDDCYANTDQTSCERKQGIAISYGQEACLPDIFLESFEEERGCVYNGISYSHGQAWCDVDGDREAGNDEVGSRHVKLSCNDGEVVQEECRDYREEFCVEEQGIAQCRINRWQDCWSQEDASSCLDQSQRDCAWEDNMVPRSQRSESRCYPIVSPGFVFWKNSGGEVCELGNEVFDEEIGGVKDLMNYKLPKDWRDGAAKFCSAMGDCGNKYNTVETVSRKSFFSTARLPKRDFLKVDIKEKVNARFNVNPFIILNGKEFECKSCDVNTILETDRKFFEELYQLTPTDIIFGGYEFHIPHNALCSVWNVRKGGADCNRCFEGNADCSEYTCRSIDPQCLFEFDAEGFPKCFKAEQNQGPLKIELEFPEEEVEQTNKFLGIWGYELVDPKTPWDFINVRVKTNRPSTCSLSFIPDLDFELDLEKDYSADVELAALGGQLAMKAMFVNYYDILFDPNLKVQFNTTHDFNVKAPSLYFLDELITRTAEIQNVIQIFNVDRSKGTLSKLNSRVKRYSGLLGDSVSQYVERSAKLAQVLLTLQAQSNTNSLNNKKKLFYMLTDLQRTPRRIYVFAKCEDRAGNKNTKDTYFNMAVTKDDKAPKILSISPSSGSIVESGFMLKVNLNEPSLCRYSFDTDKIYESMEIMECSFLSPPFSCSSEILFDSPILDMYVKCKDNPIRASVYKVKFTEGGDSSFKVVDERYNVSAAHMLEREDVPILGATTGLTLHSAQENNCRYSTNATIYDNMEFSMNCNDNICTVDLETPKSIDYYIGCTIQINKPSNTNLEGEFVKYRKR